MPGDFLTVFNRFRRVPGSSSRIRFDRRHLLATENRSTLPRRNNMGRSQSFDRSLSGLLAILGSIFLQHSTASEFRGIWVDAFGPGFFNAAQVKKLAEDCRKYNFNAVLVEMRRRG